MLPLVAQIPPPPFDRFSLGPLDVRMYGILIAIGAYLGLRIAVRRYERFGGEPEFAERVALWIIVAAFIGARVGYVIPRFLDNPSGTPFIEDPLAILAIWEGGLTFFGGLFAGALAGYLLVRRWGGDVPAFADAVAPALPLAQAIGRWGNYFNQELYGTPTDLPWAVRIERADPRFPGVDTFHPTFLYESLGNLLLVAGLLLLERTGKLRRGALLWAYAIGYGILRALVESLRVDTDARYLGLSRNNWIAIATMLVAVAGLIWWQRRGTTPVGGEGGDADVAADGQGISARTSNSDGDPAGVAEMGDGRGSAAVDRAAAGAAGDEMDAADGGAGDDDAADEPGG